MRNLFVFLVVSMIADIYAMEIPKSKPIEPVIKGSIKHKFLHRDNRSSSTSSSPSRSAKESGISINISKKSAKLTKSNDDLFNSQSSIGQQLLKAIEEKDDFTVMDILNPPINTVDQLGRTPLIRIIQNDNVDLVKECLKKDIEVNKADLTGNTALHHAVLRCNETIIQFLLHDHRINSSLKNKNDLCAYQLLENKTKKLLLECLLVRSVLDAIILEKVCQLQASDMRYIDTDYMNKIIENVKSTMSAKKDCETEATKLPLYATHEFIRKMILCRMQQEEVLQNK